MRGQVHIRLFKKNRDTVGKCEGRSQATPREAKVQCRCYTELHFLGGALINVAQSTKTPFPPWRFWGTRVSMWTEGHWWVWAEHCDANSDTFTFSIPRVMPTCVYSLFCTLIFAYILLWIASVMPTITLYPHISSQLTFAYLLQQTFTPECKKCPPRPHTEDRPTVKGKYYARR